MDQRKTGMTIAKLRKDARLTQASLAEKLGVSDKAVSKWERGIASPDISLWNKLSILLDTDIETLIYGHSLREDWIGVLVLDDKIQADTIVYNKPLIQYLISQFLLVGLNHIVIVGEVDIEIPGIYIEVVSELNQWFTHNVFLIDGNQFLYGPNLTKHFMRAMSGDQPTVIAAMKNKGRYELLVDENKVGRRIDSDNYNRYWALPYLFLPKGTEVKKIDDMLYKPIHVETMVRGMIHFDVTNYDEVYSMASFVKMMEEHTGESISCLEEIKDRRGIKERNS